MATKNGDNKNDNPIMVDYKSEFAHTDPAFAERLDAFTFDEVVTQKGQDLPPKIRWMAILATLIGCQSGDEFKRMVPIAIHYGVTPVEVKEIVYQAVAYLGIGRAIPFLRITNKIFEANGMELPLADQTTTTMKNRREMGTQAQVDIFGEGMKDFWQSGPDDTKHINYWLAANCFGDYYTRTGLNYGQREMITFCFLAAQGGCERQLISHAKGNMRVGNDKHFLISLISQCLPYIGYPRSLNAVACVMEATKGKEEEKND